MVERCPSSFILCAYDVCDKCCCCCRRRMHVTFCYVTLSESELRTPNKVSICWDDGGEGGMKTFAFRFIRLPQCRFGWSSKGHTHSHIHPHAFNAECVYVRNGQKVSCNHKQMQWRPTTKMAIINFISVSLLVCVACLMPPNQPTQRSRYKCALSVRVWVRESLWKIRCRILFLFLFSYNEQPSHPRFDFEWRNVGCRVSRATRFRLCGKNRAHYQLGCNTLTYNVYEKWRHLFLHDKQHPSKRSTTARPTREYASERDGGTHFE